MNLVMKIEVSTISLQYEDVLNSMFELSNDVARWKVKVFNILDMIEREENWISKEMDMSLVIWDFRLLKKEKN